MTTATWPEITALAEVFRTQIGGCYGYVAAALEHDHRALKPEIERTDMSDERERPMSTNYHTVTVTTRLDDEGTPDETRRVEAVRLACTAPEGADCRTYPECGCEQFNYDAARTHDGAGHPRVSGRECFIKGWFDAEGAVYVGSDADDARDDYVPAVDRTGHISISFMDEWPEWEWATPPATKEGDRG